MKTRAERIEKEARVKFEARFPREENAGLSELEYMMTFAAFKAGMEAALAAYEEDLPSVEEIATILKQELGQAYYDHNSDNIAYKINKLIKGVCNGYKTNRRK